MPAPTPSSLPSRSGWYLLAGLLALVPASTIMRASDLWFHLAAGRLIQARGAVPSGDPWSFSCPGEPWVNHEWLTDVSLATWEQAFGVESLVYWKLAILTATFLLFFRALLLLTDRPATSFLALAGGVAVASPFLDLRPQLYTFLCLALLLNLTLARPRPSLWLPGLFWLWGNLHAGFFFGLLILPLLLGPALLDPQRRVRAALIGLGCGLACLANPFGWKSVLSPLEYGFRGSSPFLSLAEWLPPWVEGGIRSPAYPWAVVVMAVSMITWWARPDWRPRGWTGPWLLLLTLLTTAMSLRSRRFIPLFGLTETLLTAPLLAHLLSPWLDRLPRRALWSAAAVAVLLAAGPPRNWIPNFSVITAEWTFPRDMCDFLKVNRIQGRVFNYYNWGGYLQWRAQGILIYIDGRSDTIYDDRTYLDYLRVLRADPGWQAIVEGSGADYFLWPRTQRQPRDLLATGRWVAVYQDGVSLLIGRAGQVPRGLVPPGDSPQRRVTRALEAMAQGQPQEAEQLLEEAVSERPDLVLAYPYLVALQRARGREDLAGRTLQRARSLHPHLELETGARP